MDATLWAEMFHLHLPVLEKVLRPVAVYLLLVFALRAFGKRVLAQLNPFDLVVLLMLSNTVQNAIIGNDSSLSGGIIGAAALLGMNALLVRLYYRGAAADRWLAYYERFWSMRLDDLERAIRKGSRK